MRIVSGGLVGYETGMFWSRNIPEDNDIDADNDGVMIPVPEFNIDLSKIASQILGKQASMMQAYRLHRIKVGIRPVDDVSDNDFYAAFSVAFNMYPATEHALTALNLARKIENADEAGQLDGDSLFMRDDNGYTGFRYGWYSGDEDTVQHVTGNGVPGMSGEWYLNEIAAAYEAMTEPNKERNLFDGRFPNQMQVQHIAAWSTGPHADSQDDLIGSESYDSGFQPLDSESNYRLDVLPLIKGSIKHSSGDEPGLVDDDYRVYVEVEFTPEIGGGF